MQKAKQVATIKRKRIAHIAGGLTTGGVEEILYNYCSKLKRSEYEFVYISYDTPDPDTKKRFEDIGFIVYEVTKKRDNLIKSCREVIAILKKHDINIIHSHMTLMCFVTNFAAMLVRIKVRIAHAHFEIKGTGLKKVIFGVYKILNKLSSTDYFTCGDDAAKIFGSRAIRKEKVYFMSELIDPKRFEYCAQTRESVREEFGIGGRTCIGHIGRFTEQKNHRFLIDVFSAYHSKQPESVLMLIGEGALMESIREQASRLGLAGCVIFVGSSDRVPKLYQAMDLFMLPSLYEGLGLVRIEAQFAGLPVLASDCLPREMTFSDAVKYKPLDDGADSWADTIEEMLNTDSTKHVPQKLKIAYNADREVAKLDSYYTDALERH